MLLNFPVSASSRASRSLSNEIDTPVNLVTAFEKTLLYQQIQDQLQPLLQAKAKLPRPPRSCVWPQFNQYATGILQQVSEEAEVLQSISYCFTIGIQCVVNDLCCCLFYLVFGGLLQIWNEHVEE